MIIQTVKIFKSGLKNENVVFETFLIPILELERKKDRILLLSNLDWELSLKKVAMATYHFFTTY